MSNLPVFLLVLLMFSCGARTGEGGGKAKNDVATIQFTPGVFKLNSKSTLKADFVLSRPLAEYLQPLAPGLSAAEVAAVGNYQFSFYVDGELAYVDNLHPGAPSATQKQEQTRINLRLVDYPFPEAWSAYLWGRFMYRAGGDLLQDGEHDLKLEIRPYVESPELTVGELIATGLLTIDARPVVLDTALILDTMQLSPLTSDRNLQAASGQIGAAPLKLMRAKVEENVFKEITSVVALRGGEIVLEEYFNGADRQTTHDVRSVGKTFASTVTGIAIAEGYLENEQQQLGEFYALEDFDHYHPDKEKITLQELLTMHAPLTGNDDDFDSPGNEEYMYPTADWVKFTLGLPLLPGEDTGWKYFTAGVVVLGDVLHQIVPGGLEAYAEAKLFGPLGIKDYQWQYTPQGVANTAGGLQMSSLDFARYGQLYLNRGEWRGKQILPANWVEKSFTRQQAIPGRENGFYGYLFWNKTYHVGGQEFETYYCSGNGGNKIFVFPAHDLVVVVTATAYNRPYAHPQVDELMEMHVLPAVAE